eukprot:16765_1
MCTNQYSIKWILLNSYPTNTSSITIPTGIDRNNYIVIDRDYTDINCIYKYDIDNDKWTKIDGFSDVQITSHFSAALDVNKQMLFLVNQDSITQIQLNNSETKNYENDDALHIAFDATGGKTIAFNDSLLIIGGEYNASIWQWKLENKRLVKFGDMYKRKDLEGFGLIYNQKNNCLLLFGGEYNCTTRKYILEFNINKKQWNKLDVSLPKRRTQVCCTMAIKNRYVLIFGGISSGGGVRDNIYIYSIKHKTIKESKIKCPSKGEFNAITINDNISDEKLVFGYIR